MPDKNDPAELAKQTDEAVKAFIATQNDIHAKLEESVQGSTDEAKAAVKTANELAEKIQGLSQQILDIEQEMSSEVIKGKAAPETLGQMLIKSDAFKEYAQNNTQGMVFKANTITGQEGSPATNSDTLVPAQRLPGIVPGAFRELRIADVLPQGQTASNAIEYTRELLFTNNAAETNEGTAKPESVLTFELVNTPVVTIPTFLKASTQILDDAPALASYIDNRLRYAVEYRTDSQLLNGNGTNPNLSGILDTGNHTVFTPTTGENELDGINRAIYAVWAAEYAPTAIIMNPADWGVLERMKVGTSDDRYIIGNPNGPLLTRVLWGWPVVLSNACPSGTFIVGAFDISHQVFTRMETVVKMFEEDEDNVQKNLITIRAENRKALATYRPASVQAGSYTL